jgi:predicted nucleotidyltransferase component of viral defense system
MLSDSQVVELFHLHFVRLLCSGPDKARFAIKGGCNLRFFFESIRYSEDIDLDVARTPVHTLKEKVSRILEGPALVLPLKSRGISVREVSAPKQTETTQRWKVALDAEGRSLPLHTKLEFSRRKTTEEAKVEPVAASVLADYQLMPLLAPHYPLAAALRQKIGALVGRSTVQARDVFDLAVLLGKTGGKVDALGSMRAQIPKAIERAMDVSFADFKSQVASYLKPEQLDEYGSREVWEAMQGRVVEQLEKALS